MAKGGLGLNPVRCDYRAPRTKDKRPLPPLVRCTLPAAYVVAHMGQPWAYCEHHAPLLVRLCAMVPPPYDDACLYSVAPMVAAGLRKTGLAAQTCP